MSLYKIILKELNQSGHIIGACSDSRNHKEYICILNNKIFNVLNINNITRGVNTVGTTESVMKTSNQFWPLRIWEFYKVIPSNNE